MARKVNFICLVLMAVVAVGWASSATTTMPTPTKTTRRTSMTSDPDMDMKSTDKRDKRQLVRGNYKAGKLGIRHIVQVHFDRPPMSDKETWRELVATFPSSSTA